MNYIVVNIDNTFLLCYLNRTLLDDFWRDVEKRRV